MRIATRRFAKLRRAALTAAVTLSVTAANAAPPVFVPANRAPAAKPSTRVVKPGWGLPRFGRLLGKVTGQQATPPQTTPAQTTRPSHNFAPQELAAKRPQPTGMQQFADTLANNRVTAAVRSMASPKPTAPTPDALSLNKPTSAPTAEMYLSMAGVAEQSGDLGAARRLFQQAIAADPGSVAALRKYGRFEDRQGRLAEAEKLYQQAVAANPGHAGALNDYGLCLARQNRMAESQQALEQAIVLKPAKALYRNNVAKVLVARGDIERAAAHLEAVHGPAIAQFNAGQLLVGVGDMEEARRRFQMAAKLDPGFEPARTALAASPAPVEPTPSGAAPTAPQVASRPALPQLATPTLPAATVSARLSAGVGPSAEMGAVPTGQPVVAAPSYPQLLPPIGE
ncbi:MAG: tetratricopeptide repeat protein [Planctomycetota bacterium]